MAITMICVGIACKYGFGCALRDKILMVNSGNREKWFKVAFHNPRRILLFFLEKVGIRKMNDEDYAHIIYEFKFGRKINLDNPMTFNEKIQWLKLNDRNPQYSKLVDKYEAKEFVKGAIGEQYVIPSYGVWNAYSEIDFAELPDSFVLKCTHDSGSIVFVKDKNSFDEVGAKQRFDKTLKANYYHKGHEWAYENVKPRIIAEKLLETANGDLKDYKVFVLNGIPRMIQVDYGRFTNHRRNLYTPEWEYIHGSLHYPTDPDYVIEKPGCLDELLSVAAKLAKRVDIPFLRTDFYIVDDHIYFGEMTLYPGNGQEVFTPDALDFKLGEYLELPVSGREECAE